MGPSDQNEYIRATCKLLYETLQLPVFYSKVHNNEDIHALVNEQERSNPLFADKTELVRVLIQQAQLLDVPNIHTTNFGESFVIVPYFQDGAPEATIVIGPSSTHRLTNETIHTLLRDFNINSTSEWISYLQELPLVTTKRLFHIGILAHNLLNKVMLDVTFVIEKNFRYEQPKSKKLADVIISDRRESLEFHGLFEIEKQLLSSIRNGDKTAFFNMTLTSNYDGSGILSNHSRLRNNKNIGICAIALATRAAIEGGLYPEIAYTISDHHIQHIEELHDSRAVEVAIGDALIDFVERVSNSRRKHLSKPIATCQEYIFNHLYEDIHLSVLADKVGLQENYLSQLFKKESGVTITQFIQQEKVEEAKKLLDLTPDPITAIAAKLNFYDQTHFIKIFKRYTGVTPKKYRDKKKLDMTSGINDG
jgi:AraC-like DNA-binding protein